jgi:hypothetical protein
MRLVLDTNSIEDYETFLAVKRLPAYRFIGSTAEFADEYASLLGCVAATPSCTEYHPSPFLFDYQADIARLAIRKQKFAIFADCGLGKTLIFGEWIWHVSHVLPEKRRILVVSPLMVIRQTVQEFKRWYGDGLPIDIVPAAGLQDWLNGCGPGGRIAITNYDALSDDLTPGDLGALVLDESSMLKSHYGKWGQVVLRLGRGLEWKLAGTGTPAPNDRIEYANHAVFLDAFPSVNAFLARFFVNRGQTCERWELKPHAVRPFHVALSHWSVFLVHPEVYGWRDNTRPLPPIHIHVHNVPLTDEQNRLVHRETGALFADNIGGITGRAKCGQLAKGYYAGKRIATNKPAFIAELVRSWPAESTIVWCLYNAEQDLIEEALPEAVSIRGETPYEARQEIIDNFKAGRVRVLISKPKVLGFGLNLEIATRHVFSGLQDSYEQFYQAVKRSNRYGAVRPLNVHIPLVDIERPMVATVMAKMRRIERDAAEQERIFCDVFRTPGV